MRECQDNHTLEQKTVIEESFFSKVSRFGKIVYFFPIMIPYDGVVEVVRTKIKTESEENDENNQQPFFVLGKHAVGKRGVVYKIRGWMVERGWWRVESSSTIYQLPTTRSQVPLQNVDLLLGASPRPAGRPSTLSLGRGFPLKN